MIKKVGSSVCWLFSCFSPFGVNFSYRGVNFTYRVSYLYKFENQTISRMIKKVGSSVCVFRFIVDDIRIGRLTELKRGLGIL
jgi:hypothetical protein